ncbi:MAG: DEAD/DEAH box helicase family protein, partial [bacterium]|nr:DEAD/DEAH box helicase family protein [bacterium]
MDQPARRGPTPRRTDPAGGQLDYRITDTDDIEAGGERTKYKANVEAIKTLKKIEAEGRSATAEEQAILVKYTGWGGLKNAFEGWQKGWENAPAELRELLTEEEYASARRSTPNAHYTSPKVVKAIWAGLEKLGFKGGRINEPAIGTGLFYGLIPDAIAARSRLFGVELESLSARIAKQLYQSASIENRGFQDVRYPDNFFDLFISNVPFDERTHPHDPDMPRSLNFNLHDFYFAKALKKTRPGGLIAFITSKGTMDKGNPAMRRYMAKQADFVGAVRLPRSAFGKIAGTEVFTDIIVLQKRAAGQENQSQPFENVVAFEQDGKTYNINEYFAAHPDNILGKLSYAGSMHRSDEMTVEDAGIDLGLAGSIIGDWKLPTEIDAKQVKHDEEMHQPEYLQVAPENVKERAYVVQGKDVYQNVDGVLVKVKAAKAVLPRLKKMIGVRDAARKLISLQINPDSTDKQVDAARKALNKQYDNFTGSYKPFHDRYNQRTFTDEPDLPLLLALENYDNETKKATKAKIFSERTQYPRHQITSAESPADAVAISMSEKARIDTDYVASLLGITPEQVPEQILGQAYENPETGTWEPRWLYLSGNVRAKLEAARAAAQMDPKYKPNIEALEAVQPEDVPPEDISVRLGAPWVPAATYEEFAAHLTGRKTIRITSMPQDGSWVVSGSGSSPRWETGDFKTSDLLAKVLNHKQPKVWWKDKDGNRHVDQEATTAAQTMADQIKEEFEKWIWQDAGRTKTLARLYNDTFNNTVLPEWDGSYLQFPGMSHTALEGGKLRPHQVNAVARFLTSGNLLMAHAVGAGKTYAGIAMAMEARRTGMAKKPVFVVPNHKVDDWRVDFLKLYPSANILYATTTDFQPKNRQKLMNRIATGDWDAVIVPMTSFERIQMSPSRVRAFFQEQLDELEIMIREQKASKGSDKSITKQLEKSKSALEERLKKLSAGWKKDAGPYFDELGIDMLFVDEAHAYKNLFFSTQMERISGLQNSQTQRSFDMYLKTQYLNQTTNQRGVVFATGTPITNTIAEMFTMQRYLQPQALSAAGISAFDSWASNFGDTVTDVEVDPTGGGFRLNTRFAKFTNLPELIQMFRSVTDVVTKKDTKIPLPKVKTGKPITVQSEPTDDVRDYIQSLVARAEAVKGGRVKPNEDNMLKITNDGRHVALDPRLRVPGASDSPGSKINQCVEQVKDVYDSTAKDKGTQIIWCDLSTPGKGWSIYDELKQKLIDAGIPERQIAFIHDAKDEKQQATLYDRMNRGDLRVIIASTEKMGTGANVQRRLK